METLHDKLVHLQTTLKVGKNRKNKFADFSFRNTEDILEALKPEMAKLGLTIIYIDKLIGVGNELFIEATARLSDGKSHVETPGYAAIDFGKGKMDKCQMTGSASTYARKYATNALLALDDANDPDANDNSKSEPKNEQKAGKPKEEKPYLNKGTDAWNKAVAALTSGGTTFDKIAQHYRLSKDNQAELKSIKAQ